MTYQIHLADASGDAVVISAGPDGEVAYTRKLPGNGYLVSTNFNLANPGNGTKSWRYDKATALLAELLKSEDVTTYALGLAIHEDEFSLNLMKRILAFNNDIIGCSKLYDVHSRYYYSSEIQKNNIKEMEKRRTN